MTPRALVLSGPAGGLRVTAPRCRIGRATDNDLVLDDPAVSRHHCELAWEAGGWVLRDLGSANGTWLEGRRVSRRRLEGEGTLGVGRARLHLSIDGADAPAAPGAARRRGLRPGLLAAAALVMVAWAAGRCGPPDEGEGRRAVPSVPDGPGAGPAAGAPDEGSGPPLTGVASAGLEGTAAYAPGANDTRAAVRAHLRLAEDRWSRRAMAPANLWEACRAWSEARALLAGWDGGAGLRPEVEARRRACEAALDAEVARLEFTGVRHRRFGRDAEAEAVWRRILQVVPDPGDPRHQTARGRLSAED